MEQNNITIVASFDGYRPLKDGSISMRFITQEMPSDKIVSIHRMLDTYGILFFKAGDNLTSDEKRMIDEVGKMDVDVLDEPVSLSQRLRRVLFVVFKNQEEYEDFSEFYRHKMEQMITHFKNRINE